MGSQSFWRGGGEQRRLGPPRPHGAPAPAPEYFTFLLAGAEDNRSAELAGTFLMGVAGLLQQRGHLPAEMISQL
jgi:hypothetical protein